MTDEFSEELGLGELRERFLEYTRRAYRALPAIERPRILDIGCGNGIPTLELARLSDGEVVGIDIDGEALAELEARIERLGLGNRVSVVHCSLLGNRFADGSFDILWDEGALHLIDARRSITECRRLLRLGGFLVSGETTGWLESKRKLFSRHGLRVVDRLPLPSGCWWTDYYEPLETRIHEIRAKYGGLRDLRPLRRHEREIEMVRENPTAFDCAYYLLRKGD